MDAALGGLQDIFYRVCKIPSESLLAGITQELGDLARSLEEAIAAEPASSQKIQKAYSYVHCISVIAQAACRSELQTPRSRQGFEEDVRAVLQGNGGLPVTAAHKSQSYAEDDTFNYDPWRQWYSEHIAHPYYDNREREWLLKQIPGMTRQKMQTWFVNVRRRSGWSELYKKYADNKRENMEAIFKACEDPDPAVNDKVAPEARKLVAKIKQYLTLESKKTEIAPWLSELLSEYKQSSIKAIKSEDSDESQPFTSSSASKSPVKAHKRKASDANSNITPNQRPKASLYKTPHHPPTPASSVSPNASSKPIPAVPATATSSASGHSSPDLQTSSSLHKSAKEESPEHIIPPFSAWTPPTQSSYIQQAHTPLSAFVPAQAQAYAHAYTLPPPLQLQAPAQSFISNNHITYNMSPTAYAYPQLHQSPPIMYGMPGFQAANSWHQPPQWPQTFHYTDPAYYTAAPSVAPSHSSNYSMLANLSTTPPGKRKYTEEGTEMPPTPTGSYKRGRTSASSYTEPAIIDCTSPFADPAFQYDAGWDSAHQGLDQ